MGKRSYPSVLQRKRNGHQWGSLSSELRTNGMGVIMEMGEWFVWIGTSIWEGMKEKEAMATHTQLVVLFEQEWKEEEENNNGLGLYIKWDFQQWQLCPLSFKWQVKMGMRGISGCWMGMGQEWKFHEIILAIQRIQYRPTFENTKNNPHNAQIPKTTLSKLSSV